MYDETSLHIIATDIDVIKFMSNKCHDNPDNIINDNIGLFILQY